MSGTAEIFLEIDSPEETLLGQKVETVTLPGVCGPFQVLRRHAPLITALTAGKIRYVIDGEELFMTVKSGFAEVCDDKVSVCLDR